MKKFYSEEQVKLAIKATLERYEYTEWSYPDMVEEEFLENLSLTDDMKGVQHSITIEEGSVL